MSSGWTVFCGKWSTATSTRSSSTSASPRRTEWRPSRPATARPSTRNWRRLLADDSLTKKTIVYEGEVAGNIGCWEHEGRWLVGYWIGQAFWGKGLATRALQELTGEVTLRPLHAWVATSNVASIRVLEKCGFVRVGSQENDVEEVLFELRDSL
jgi:RimJ/RimL family protein N-acetyltransferase